MIAEYLLSLGSDILNQIEEVSIDLWKPYKNVVEELIPNAQIVADLFHVMSQINKELDDRKKLEKRQARNLKNKQEKNSKSYKKSPIVNIHYLRKKRCDPADVSSAKERAPRREA